MTAVDVERMPQLPAELEHSLLVAMESAGVKLEDKPWPRRLLSLMYDRMDPILELEFVSALRRYESLHAIVDTTVDVAGWRWCEA